MKKSDGRSEFDRIRPLWIKCQSCGHAACEGDFQKNLMVCEKCGFQHKMSARQRVAMLADRDSFRETNANLRSGDPLEFGSEYTAKLEADMVKTSLSDAVLTGYAAMGGHDVMLGVMDFFFRGGSMGAVVGEKITALFEEAVEKRIPAVVVSSSGGARMQEGVVALMQMAKTSAVISRMNRAGIPYISVLADPTTGGVSASFASLGDIILAEAGAIIGFSGARVIEQTIRQKLPPGFQSAEFYLDHGFVDRVVRRSEMRDTLIGILGFFNGGAL